jgi:hypothetical protein
MNETSDEIENSSRLNSLTNRFGVCLLFRFSLDQIRYEAQSTKHDGHGNVAVKAKESPALSTDN